MDGNRVIFFSDVKFYIRKMAPPGWWKDGHKRPKTLSPPWGPGYAPQNIYFWRRRIGDGENRTPGMGGMNNVPQYDTALSIAHVLLQMTKGLVTSTGFLLPISEGVQQAGGGRKRKWGGAHGQASNWKRHVPDVD